MKTGAQFVIIYWLVRLLFAINAQREKIWFCHYDVDGRAWAYFFRMSHGAEIDDCPTLWCLLLNLSDTVYDSSILFEHMMSEACDSDTNRWRPMIERNDAVRVVVYLIYKKSDIDREYRMRHCLTFLYGVIVVWSIPFADVAFSISQPIESFIIIVWLTVDSNPPSAINKTLRRESTWGQENKE